LPPHSIRGGVIETDSKRF